MALDQARDWYAHESEALGAFLVRLRPLLCWREGTAGPEAWTPELRAEQVRLLDNVAKLEVDALTALEAVLGCVA